MEQSRPRAAATGLLRCARNDANGDPLESTEAQSAKAEAFQLAQA
jgi:hypothetical protein